MKKNVSTLILVVLLALAGLLLARTLIFSSKQIDAKTAEVIPLDNHVAETLSRAIKCQTVSYENKAPNGPEFRKLHEILREAFPMAHQKLSVDTINQYSLLFTWKGRDKYKKPLLLLAHQDVVPAGDDWKEPPFSGKIVQDTIWGRGSLDDKVAVVSILQAVESLLKNNFVPERDILLAFGHDEEIGGSQGAEKIAEHLKSQGIEAEFVLDEGLMITQGMVPGIEKDVALIGIAEKGYLNVDITAVVDGGHSSMPKTYGAIDAVARAITKLNESPFTAHITPPVDEFLDHIGPEMSFTYRVVFANRWLFDPMIIGIYEKTPAGNALVRTTMATTIFDAGYKANVVPRKASSTVNIRMLPGDDREQVLWQMHHSIDTTLVKLHAMEYEYASASKVSSTKTFGYKAVATTVREIFPESLTAPNLLIAGTDSKHYSGISPNIYRFLPVRINPASVEQIHGKNERIAIQDLKNCVRFYRRLIQNTCK
ncbi:peptidase M20 (plasmid) [Fulvitalea axinellae]|uniref:Peptidase M20 n=1 Tax=Fulvitalea axinellae TaxID=1182444 RepID=A0AAU9CRJ9_9BACT|nr:peptidase M20 [Fulvitalea axinellae]